MFIADEIHHGALGASWGDAAHHSTLDCVFRLGLSGTPFRADNEQIPFLHYENGKSVPHFTRTWGDAWNQKDANGAPAPDIAPVYFRWVTGEVEAPDGEGGARTLSLDESATLEEEERGRLLTRIVTPNGQRGFVQCLLDAAHAELMLQKETDPTAAGLVIAATIKAAETIRDYLVGLGASVELVTSEHNGSVKRFARNGRDWLVSVAMVSEGVDIPRLKVLAYLTNERTELAFLQGIGRIVRTMDGRVEQGVFAYLPKLSDFVGYAKEIEKERTYVLGPDEPEPPAMRTRGNRGQAADRQWTVDPDGVLVLRSDGYVDGLTFRGRHFTEQNIDDLLRLSGGTPKAQAELAQTGRTLWAGIRLTALAEVAEQTEQTIDDFLAERLARVAAKAESSG